MCDDCVPFPDNPPFCDLSYDHCNQSLETGETPPYSCLQDCTGSYYRDGKDPILHNIDDCGVCNLLEDMNNLKDACGMCTNVAGYDSATECTPDCKGNFSLPDSLDCSNTQTCYRAFIDDCGDCWFSNETKKKNFKMDHCGFCPDNPLYNKTDDCGREIKCPPISFENANFLTTLAGSTALGKCDELYYGSPTLYCNLTGHWNQTINGNPCSSIFFFTFLLFSTFVRNDQ